MSSELAKPNHEDAALHWHRRSQITLAPLCWPLIAFAETAWIFLVVALVAAGVFVFLGLLLGMGLEALLFVLPALLVMAVYPALAWIWTWFSKRKELGLIVELIPAIRGAHAHPYRPMQEEARYRVRYRGKVIEQGELRPESLILQTYYFSPHSVDAAPVSVSSIRLKSKRSKAPVWWFAFAKFFERGHYVIQSSASTSTQLLMQQVRALEERLALPERSISHHYEYQNALAERAVAKALSSEDEPPSTS